MAADGKTSKHITAIMEERRKYDGGNDGEGSEDARDPAEIPKEDLLKRARVHMMQTACTHWDESEHCYKFLPVCRTPRRMLGHLGIGVQLYFQFLCQMGVVFLILTLLTAPLLATSAMGDMVSSEGAQQAFGMLSIANLGTCGAGNLNCTTSEQLRSRKAGFDFELPGGLLGPDMRVKDLTPVFGTLDGVALLLFMSFGLWFTKFWIPREVRIHDGRHVTPADFTVRVENIPRRLRDDAEHGRYQSLLRTHFQEVLRTRCGVVDDNPVEEVSLVREYYGAIQNYAAQGQHVLRKQDIAVKLRQEQDSKRKAKLQKQLDSINRQIVKMEKSFGADAGKSDEEREVCNTAFVTLRKDSYVESLKYQYRFAQSMLFRCCQDKDLRFQGNCISVQQAGEPTDLFWENMDFNHCTRRVRIACTCLATAVILAVCLVAMLYFKTIGVPAQAPTPSADIWVVRSLMSTECLQLCNWKLYTDRLCRSPQSGISDIAGFWDVNGVTSGLNHSAGGLCSNNVWSSPSCTGNTSQDEAQWVGIHLNAPAHLACLEFQQAAGSALGEVELYACSSSDLANFSGNRLEDRCIGLQDLMPSTAARDGWAPSGRQLVLSDSRCRRNVSLTAAHRALEARVLELRAGDPSLSDEAAGYRASTTDPAVHCYCHQQELAAGVGTFRSPPYDKDPSKILCKQWIYYQNVKLSMMVGSVIAVCLLNQVLVVLFSYFVIWERHDTWTRQMNSQFVKLFLAQFLNTAMIVLIVNANWRGTLSHVWFIETLGLGQGTYDDFDFEWFTAVGSGLCLTILIQVFTATTPGLFMSYVVNPIMIRIFRMGLATQKILNQVYVFPEWNLSCRLAQTTTVIFVIVMYSGGMPVLNAIGCLYCFAAYWLDKWCLLKGSQKPPSYDASLLRLAVNMFPLAGFLHAVITLWCFGNQNVFPASWSALQQFFGSLIDMSEERYLDLTEEYYIASEERRNAIFINYLHARCLDMARWSGWLLLCIFLVFLAYYVTSLLNALFLRPLLAPIVVGLRGKCRRQVRGNEDASLCFDAASQGMLSKGLCPSYLMHMNPRYSVLLESLQQGRKEVEDAKRQLEDSDNSLHAARNGHPSAV